MLTTPLVPTWESLEATHDVLEALPVCVVPLLAVLIQATEAEVARTDAEAQRSVRASIARPAPGAAPPPERARYAYD